MVVQYQCSLFAKHDPFSAIVVVMRYSRCLPRPAAGKPRWEGYSPRNTAGRLLWNASTPSLKSCELRRRL